MFQRFFEEGLAQASYLVACDRSRDAIVIDPRRDVDIYVASAAQQGLRIVAAVDTHIHADFVSGSRELAAVGTRTVAGPGAALGYDFDEVCDGATLTLGDLRIHFLHTPGHTQEHICVLASRPGEPVRVFTGDTLFVGAVGRPDLCGEEETRRLAGELYESLRRKLLTLDGATEVHPGHGAGSLCGAGIGAEPHSTIAQERRFNTMLQHTSREAFVAAVLDDLPDTPPYFARVKKVNQEGPVLRSLAAGYPGPRAIDVLDAASAARQGATVIDLRSAAAFCAAHPEGALNIAYGPKVGYWAGWVVPDSARIILLASNPREATDAAVQLLRVGFDDVDACVDEDLRAWRGAGLPISQIPQISARELHERLARREDLTVLDVRSATEFRGGHIEGALHVPVAEVRARARDLSRHAAIATICESGLRSTLAASVLSQAGVGNVLNVAGGMAADRQLSGRPAASPQE
jgi:hydroxyacylglutathione hydrolase